MMDFSSVKRIVIKVGTSTLAHNTGNLNIRRVSKLIEVMSDLKNSGKDVIFVTSGAQGVGAAKAGLHSKPKEMPKKQACAAIGQCELCTFTTVNLQTTITRSHRFFLPVTLSATRQEKRTL